MLIIALMIPADFWLFRLAQKARLIRHDQPGLR